MFYIYLKKEEERVRVEIHIKKSKIISYKHESKSCFENSQIMLDEKHMLPKNPPLNIRITAGDVHRNRIYYAHLSFFVKFEQLTSKKLGVQNCKFAGIIDMNQLEF